MDLNEAVRSAQEIQVELNKLDLKDAKVAELLKAQSELNSKIEILAKPEAHERKIRFEGAADTAKVDLVVLSMLNHLANSRDAKGQPTGILRDYIGAQLRTMTTGGTATGAELIDTVMVPRLWEDIHLGAKVAGLFTQIDMPSKAIELPVGLGDVTFYKPSGEGVAVTATDAATAKRTLTAYPLKAQVDISDELDQDSVIALMPAFRASLIRNASETIDDVLLNGDTDAGATNINYEGTALAASSRFLIGFDGLLHYCLHEVTGQKKDLAAAPSVALMNTVLNLLGKYGVNPERVAFISDLWIWGVLRGVAEFLTIDKAGAQATLKTGQVPTPFGSPMVISAQLLKADATGLVDDTSGDNVKGRFLAVNRDMWLFGVRKPITIATERSESKGLTSIVVTMRIALQCFGDRSSAAYCHTALGYNGTI